MRKKRMGGIAVIILLSFLCGCSGKKQDGSLTPAPSEEMCEISIENITLTEKNENLAQIETLVNEITVPSIGCRVKLVDCPIAEHEDLLKKIRAGIEQIDLVGTGLTASLSELASSGAVIPLEKLLHEYGGELEEKEGRLLQATTIGGHIYAIPANLYCGRAEGIGYNADMAEKYNIEIPAEINLEILTLIGRELKEKNSSLYLTTQGDGALSAFDSFYDMETFGGDFTYGVIMNPVENTKIVNVYDTDEYRSYCRVLQKWKEEGYLPGDSLTSGMNGQDYFNRGMSFFQFSSVSPGTQLMAVKKELGFEERYIPITRNRLTTRLVQEFAWGITDSCEHPEKAMELLNLIYTNGELADLLQYGRENFEYIITDDGGIRPIADENNKTSYSSYFSIYGDTALMLHYESDSDITIEDIIEYSRLSEPGMAFGYVFQADSVFVKVQTVQNVVNEYRPVLETGMAEDSDQLLDEFINALQAAGINDIISENQRQLDEWLANKEEVIIGQ